ncbi:CAP domain-containing protein [Palleronia sp.]|uniref:CAP domain-containing protein n=1 Tax=Palleronia sp. TaxID=1940284 RepID=UPI0035C86F44
MIRPLLLALALAACGPAERHVADGDVNARRAAAGLPPVTRSVRADRAAARHAQDMAANGFFAHQGSDGSSHTDRLRAVGCGPGAENLAWGQTSAEAAMDAWMASEGHRRNILNPDLRAYGLANAGDIWVMVLATRC